jgi:4'-phosphopantetheinyl transferase
MLKIYQVNITPLYNESVFSDKMKMVRAERQKKILACRAKEDRCRSLAAGLLLRMALSHEGVSYMEAEFSYGDSGKPYLKDSDLFFSRTHAGEMAVCALADREVGADIEQLSRFAGQETKAARIARRIMTEEELRLWKEEPTGEELVRIWTRKESYAKYTGEGLSCDFAHFDTNRDAVYEYPEVPEGYFLSVCMGRASALSRE